MAAVLAPNSLGRDGRYQDPKLTTMVAKLTRDENSSILYWASGWELPSPRTTMSSSTPADPAEDPAWASEQKARGPGRAKPRSRTWTPNSACYSHNMRLRDSVVHHVYRQFTDWVTGSRDHRPLPETTVLIAIAWRQQWPGQAEDKQAELKPSAMASTLPKMLISAGH